MQSGRSTLKVVEKFTGAIRHYYYRASEKETKQLRKRAHRRRVKQDLHRFDEDEFDDTPRNSERLTSYELW